MIEVDFNTRESNKKSAIPCFIYENGYTLLCTDLGNAGVKVELIHSEQESAAIILNPDKSKEYGKWLLQRPAQKDGALPKELSDILERLV